MAGAAAVFFTLWFLYKYYVNQRLKGRFKKFDLPRISAVAITVTLLTAFTLGGYFNGASIRNREHRLYAGIGFLRAENTQYVPDILTLSEAMQPVGVENAVFPLDDPDDTSGYKNFRHMSTDVSLLNYGEIVKMLGIIESPYNPDFTVLDLKEEAKKVFENVTVFDKWVKVKGGDKKEIGEYYRLSYDKKSRHLTLLRKRDFFPYICKEGSVLAGAARHEVLYKLDYYTETGGEVFECEIFSVLHAGGKDYIRQYQYIKNVKDKSFSKYIISPYMVLDGGGLEQPLYEIDSDNPYGTERRFVQLDYSDGNSSMLFVKQSFPSAYDDTPLLTTANLYSAVPSDVILFNTAFSSDISQYGGNSGPATVFFDGTHGDLMDMYSRQDMYRTTRRGMPQDFNGAKVNAGGDDITGFKREILYRGKNGITAYNNFSGNKTFYSGNDDKLPDAFDRTAQSVSALAKNTGAPISRVSVPSTVETDDLLFETELQSALETIAANAVNNSDLKNNYEDILKKASKFIWI